MLRVLIASIFFVVSTLSPVVASINHGNGSSFDDVTVYRGNGSTWDAVDTYRGNGSTWDQLNGSLYSDIIFYHDCEALDDANKYGGSATVTYGGSVTAETGISGNSWRTNGAGYNPIYFAISGNVDLDTGRIGFYYQPLADWSAAAYVFHDGQSSDGTYLRDYASTTLRVEYRNSGTSNTTASLINSQLYWIESKFDGANGASVYFYECTSTSSCSATPDLTINVIQGAGSDGSNLVFGSSDSTGRDAYIDQVIISNDPDRSLYDIRNVTSF